MKTFLRFTALPVLLLTAPAHAQEIGVVASANATLDGIQPGKRSRPLAVGLNVVRNERINTSATGSGQLLFLDQTTLSVAPNSDIVLDSYIYDPERDTGEMALTLTKGVLRFIGGRISKRSEAIIRTPASTIGIRGGMAIVEACLNLTPSCADRVTVTHVAGEYTRVTNEGKTIVLSRPAARATVKPGKAPVFAGLADSRDFARLNTMLEGTGNGARSQPSTEALSVHVATVRPAASGELGAPWRIPVSTSGEEPPLLDPFNLNPFDPFDERFQNGDPLALSLDPPSPPPDKHSESSPSHSQ